MVICNEAMLCLSPRSRGADLLPESVEPTIAQGQLRSKRVVITERGYPDRSRGSRRKQGDPFEWLAKACCRPSQNQRSAIHSHVEHRAHLGSYCREDPEGLLNRGRGVEVTVARLLSNNRNDAEAGEGKVIAAADYGRPRADAIGNVQSATGTSHCANDQFVRGT